MHIGHPEGTVGYFFQIFKIQDVGGRHFEKNVKSPYIRNDLTDLYEIWEGNA